MPRGGYRPGAGRPPGAKDSGPRRKPTRTWSRKKKAAPPSLPSPEDEALAKIREMVSPETTRRVRARLYNDFLKRLSRGETLSVSEQKMMQQILADLEAEVAGAERKEGVGNFTGGNAEVMTPLDYMIRIMNDSTADTETRLRAASLAAPYLHPRAGDGPGKKEDAKERAKRAASGIFAPGKPPKLEVVK